MTKGRLEAFTDGVIAVIITIMVLEMKVPHDADPNALAPLVPVFLSYVLSYIFIGIYWNNHHHMFHAVHHVNGATLWANLHLLFWLSLVPFVTGWMDENHFAPVTVAAYGAVLLGASCAYYILTRALLATHAKDSLLAKALGKEVRPNDEGPWHASFVQRHSLDTGGYVQRLNGFPHTFISSDWKQTFASSSMRL